MYRPRQQSAFFGTGSTWRRPVPVQTSANSSSNEIIDPSLLLERNIYHGLFADPIGVVSKPDEEPAGKDLEITDYKCLGSYSWIESARERPTMLVPGSPPLWKNRSLPFQVSQPDKGPRIIDQNGFRTSTGGIGYLLPVIAAVTHNKGLTEEPPFDWSLVDVVADRGALRKLVRWSNDKLAFNKKIRKSDKLYRLDLQLAGEKTLLINRVSLRFAEEHLYQTYRDGFWKEFTTPAPGCGKALDFYRIVSYDIAGLKMVVRFEVDAYDSKVSSNDQVEELAASLQAASIQSPGTLQMQGLTIQKAGEEVPQMGLLELTTRWAENDSQMDWSEVYCQLFLSQVPKHIIAYQRNGLFDKIEERTLDSAPELETAKKDAQNQMQKLVKTINRIRELVMKEGKASRLSLVCVYGKLWVYKRKSKESCLPDDVLELFE